MSSQVPILLRHLPEIYQDSNDLRLLLSAFEQVLFGPENPEAEEAGLEQKIAGIPNLFDPKPDREGQGTPLEFLPWLADWVSLEQVQAMPEQQYRKLIAQIVPLYAIRGTKQYLLEIMLLFFPEAVATVSDQALPSLKVGESRVGVDTRLGGDIPFTFYVNVLFSRHADTQPGSMDVESLSKKVSAVIDKAKPAHTVYQLKCEFVDQDQQTEAFFDDI